MTQNNTTGVGFLYFTANSASGTSAEVVDTSRPTSDFIALTDAKSPANFTKCPNQLARYRPSCNQNKWKNNRKSINNSSNPRGGSFNNSYSPNASHNNSSFGDNSSFNNSGDYSGARYNSSNNSFEKRDKFNQSNSGRKSFLHPSFMEDPWADLIKQAEMKKQQQRQEDSSD